MEVQVCLFALARQRVGSHTIALELPTASTVGDLRRTLAAQWPALRDVLGHCLIAVAEEYADDSRVIEPGAQIAVIPPVSGG